MRAILFAVCAATFAASDAWTYRSGSGQFMTTLKLESGRLRTIVHGDRIP